MLQKSDNLCNFARNLLQIVCGGVIIGKIIHKQHEEY